MAALGALACLGLVAVEEDTVAAVVVAFAAALVLVAAADIAADTAAVAAALFEDHLHSFGLEEAWHSGSQASFPSSPGVQELDV